MTISLTTEFKAFMNENFPDLELCSPLFYNWETGIRFELESSNSPLSDEDYMIQVYHRSETLFHDLFKLEDEIYLVLNVFIEGYNKKAFFPSVVKDKKILKNIGSYNWENPYLDEEDEEFKKSNRIILKCKKKDIKNTIIKKYFKSDVAELFFININKKTIYYIYDSRGCDLVANDKEAIKPIYQNFTDWILNYDREKIDNIFI